ncbi:hypothetical protein [Brevibacillus sp. NRS-1366]|uniref:hypothetical protein n=1 Tax=Brevibacillus sp. NRS-1366 TaxID=3233899 RepID=UPI003D1AFA9A
MNNNKIDLDKQKLIKELIDNGRKLSMQVTELIPLSETIRRVGLTVLAIHQDGLRVTTLRNFTEASLCEYIPKDDYNNGNFRSALWDLEKRYPELVVKEVPKPKMAIFKPTIKLLRDWTSIVIPNIDQYKFSGNDEYADIKHLLGDLSSLINESRITDKIRRFLDSDACNKDSSHELIKLKISLDILQQCKL